MAMTTIEWKAEDVLRVGFPIANSNSRVDKDIFTHYKALIYVPWKHGTSKDRPQAVSKADAHKETI